MANPGNKARETTWAREAIRAERDRQCGGFTYGPDEAARLQAVKARGAVPSGCSDAIPVAPARGPVEPFREQRIVPKGDDDWATTEQHYKAGAPGRIRDAFDQITDRSRAGAVFTVGQVNAGRAYRDLFERMAASGYKLSSIGKDAPRRSGGKVDVMDARLRDAERLAAFRSVIGDSMAKDTRRRVDARVGAEVVGSAQLRDIGRKAITVRGLVDAVCLDEQSFAEVLKRHGWTPTGKNRSTLRVALCAALDRMQGI